MADFVLILSNEMRCNFVSDYGTADKLVLMVALTFSPSSSKYFKKGATC